MLKSLLTLLTSVGLLASLLIGPSGCADPNRELCRQACQRLYECDSEEGDGSLNSAWLDSCNTLCDNADEINEEAAQCITDSSDCGAISTSCSQGADN